MNLTEVTSGQSQPTGPIFEQLAAISPSLVTRHYFVDEAGDSVIFGRKGKVLVGTEGCSNVFMLGIAHVEDPDHCTRALTELRNTLLAESYFSHAPSMQAGTKKTAICFHAKNDLPEVRWEVFKLIKTFNVRVNVAIRRKKVLAELAQTAKSAGIKHVLTANGMYDDLVQRLFRDNLHKADENHIVFARRGKSARIEALHKAIEKAKLNFKRRFKRESNKPCNIHACYPSESCGLQIIDYYLWALQRMLEKRERRFFEYLQPGYRLIMDLDDRTHSSKGAWYSDRNICSLEKMKAL